MPTVVTMLALVPVENIALLISLSSRGFSFSASFAFLRPRTGTSLSRCDDCGALDVDFGLTFGFDGWTPCATVVAAPSAAAALGWALAAVASFFEVFPLEFIEVMAGVGKCPVIANC